MIARATAVLLLLALSATACRKGASAPAKDAAAPPTPEASATADVPATPPDAPPAPAPDAAPALVDDPALAAQVEALAAFDRVESAAVGAAGTPSEVWQAYEALAVKLSAEQTLALLKHPSPVVRCYLARAVVVRFPEAVPALAPLLRDPAEVQRLEGDLGVRSTVAAYVAQLLCSSVTDLRPVQDLLLEAAGDPAYGDLRASLFACVATVRKDDAAARALALLGSGDGAIRPAAVTVLGLVGAVDAADRVAALAADPDPAVRAATAATLQALGAAQTPTVLETLLRDAEPAVRASAARAYASRPDAARVQLEALLADPDPAVQLAAAEGLAAIASPTAVVLLEPWLPAHADAPELFRILAGTATPEVAALMRRLLAAADESLRRRAVAYFTRVRDPAALPALRTLFRSTRTVSERQEVLRTLAQFGDREIVPDLRRLLEDENAVVRLDAAAALAALGDRRALPALEAAVAREPAATQAELQTHLDALRAVPER